MHTITSSQEQKIKFILAWKIFIVLKWNSISITSLICCFNLSVESYKKIFYYWSISPTRTNVRVGNFFFFLLEIFFIVTTTYEELTSYCAQKLKKRWSKKVKKNQLVRLEQMFESDHKKKIRKFFFLILILVWVEHYSDEAVGY